LTAANVGRAVVRVDNMRLAAATSRWAGCMRSAGSPYATPDAARAAVGTAYTKQGLTGRTRTQEIAIAVADGECDLWVHLSGTELALRRSAAADLPTHQRRELNDLAAIGCTATQSAARILHRPASLC
jgi:hypothetical protein